MKALSLAVIKTEIFGPALKLRLYFLLTFAFLGLKASTVITFK